MFWTNKVHFSEKSLLFFQMQAKVYGFGQIKRFDFEFMPDTEKRELARKCLSLQPFGNKEFSL